MSHLTEAESQMTRDHTFERRETTPAEREARKAFREVIPGKVMTDYAKAQKSLHECPPYRPLKYIRDQPGIRVGFFVSPRSLFSVGHRADGLVGIDSGLF